MFWVKRTIVLDYFLVVEDGRRIVEASFVCRKHRVLPNSYIGYIGQPHS